MDFFPVSPGPFLPDIAIDKKSKDDLSLSLDLENFPENIFDKQEPEKFIEPTKVCTWITNYGTTSFMACSTCNAMLAMHLCRAEGYFSFQVHYSFLHLC